MDISSGLAPFDLFLAESSAIEALVPSWLQAPPGPREGNARWWCARGKGGSGRRVLHVFRLINIRENPLNWVIKRLRRHCNRERVTLDPSPIFSLAAQPSDCQDTKVLLFDRLSSLFSFCSVIFNGSRILVFFPSFPNFFVRASISYISPFIFSVYVNSLW